MSSTDTNFNEKAKIPPEVRNSLAKPSDREASQQKKDYSDHSSSVINGILPGAFHVPGPHLVAIRLPLMILMMTFHLTRAVEARLRSLETTLKIRTLSRLNWLQILKLIAKKYYVTLPPSLPPARAPSASPSASPTKPFTLLQDYVLNVTSRGANISSLVSSDVSPNQLKGPIPTEIGFLTGSTYLDLDSN